MKRNYIYLLIYLIASIPFLFLYRFQTTPDYISYVSIAEKCLAGDFHNAVNAYWGPMFSWLLMPFIYFNCPPVLAGKFILLIAGAVIILLTSSLLKNFGVAKKARSISLLSLIPVLLYYVFMFMSPDLLLAMFLLAATVLMFSDKYKKSKIYPIYIGILGALSYFCKQYGLLFFVINFFVFSFCQLIQVSKAEKLRVAINGCVVLAITLVISFGWIYALHAKYDTWMIGSAGQYNLAVGPESSGQIHRINGLIELPNESAVSAWEDPTYYKYEPRYLSMKTMAYFVSLVLKNMFTTVAAFQSISALSIAIIICFFLMQVCTCNDSENGHKNGVVKFLFDLLGFVKSLFTNKDWSILFSLIIFVAGYMLVRADIRFISFAVVLLIVIGGVCLQKVLDTNFFADKFRTQLFLLIYFITFACFPAVELINNANYGKWHYRVTDSIQENFKQSGLRIASNLNWHDTLYIVDHLNGKYLGKTKSPDVNEELIQELTKFNIEFFLLWGTEAVVDISGYILVDDEPTYNLKVYKRVLQ